MGLSALGSSRIWTIGVVHKSLGDHKDGDRPNGDGLVNHYFFPQAFIDEKLGLTSMTLNMIPDGLRQWLARKGFRTREEIPEFGGPAGSSLPTALQLLLSSLPKNQCGRYKDACSNRKKLCEPGSGYSVDLLDKVKKLTNCNIQVRLKETGSEFDIHDNYPEVGRLKFLGGSRHHR